MYSDKNVIRRLVALMLAKGINHVVVAPGSRNAPLTQTFASHPDFRCFCVTDERGAAFFALGMIMRLQKPVAVCCTSGTALLNLGSAVAEAFYQELPLLVLSADRPAAWIGQMDGQTLPQSGVFGTLVKRAVNLPEGDTPEDRWHTDRAINEALLALTPLQAPDQVADNVPGGFSGNFSGDLPGGFPGGGPVQINIPLREPLFTFTDRPPEAARAIRLVNSLPRLDALPASLADIWRSATKRLVLAGQMLPPCLRENNASTPTALSRLADGGTVVAAEHLANLHGCDAIHTPDAVLASLGEEEAEDFAPDLLITFGGHLVSKRMKQLLRAYRPVHHWHLSPDRSAPDLFQSLSAVIETAPEPFFRLLAGLDLVKQNNGYAERWMVASRMVREATATVMEKAPFTDIAAMGLFMERLPDAASLHLANSSAVRNAQLFPLSPGIKTYCNRGTSGIDGSLSTAVGYAAVSDGPVFCVLGDLSFFYDMNALWSGPIKENLRILLFNNGGGGIFHTLPGLRDASRLDMIAGHHATSANAWAESLGLLYLSASTREVYEAHLPLFTAPSGSAGAPERPVLLEVEFPLDACTAFHAEYHHLIRKKQ